MCDKWVCIFCLLWIELDLWASKEVSEEKEKVEHFHKKKIAISWLFEKNISFEKSMSDWWLKYMYFLKPYLVDEV